MGAKLKVGGRSAFPYLGHSLPRFTRAVNPRLYVSYNYMPQFPGIFRSLSN